MTGLDDLDRSLDMISDALLSVYKSARHLLRDPSVPDGIKRALSRYIEEMDHAEGAYQELNAAVLSFMANDRRRTARTVEEVGPYSGGR